MWGPFSFTRTSLWRLHNFPHVAQVICPWKLYVSYPYSHRPQQQKGSWESVLDDQGWDLGSTISAMISPAHPIMHLYLLLCHLIFPRARAISSS